MDRILVIFTMAFAITSCASNRGIAEFDFYRSTFSSTSQAGNAILDRLAVAERQIHAKDSGIPDRPGTEVRFTPSDAAYYTNAVDPPGTAAYRRALLAVSNYNEALFGLASGQTAEVLAGNIARMGAAGASAAGEVAELGGAATGGALAGAGAVTAINTAIKALEPATLAVLKSQTRDEFRRRLLAEAPNIEAIIQTTRDSTPEVFNALVSPIVDRAIETPPRGKFSEEDKKDIRQIRELLSNWVVLLDGSLVAMKTAIEAASESGNGGLSVSGLIYSATELEAIARATRSSLAGLGQ